MAKEGKKIDFYLDVVSLYSYFAYFYLLERKELLASHGVEIEYFPIYLGGVLQASGNDPPWKLSARGKYLFDFDGPRSAAHFGKEFEIPKFFPLKSMLSQRCMTYIKSAHPTKLEATYAALFDALWQESINLAEEDLLLQVLQRVFTREEAAEILAATKTDEVNGQLMRDTEHAWKDLGAYGAPWFWVGDGEGRSEAFFGSDRWGHMWKFLGLPYEEVKLLPPQM